jgi:hypothetical protein
MTRLWSAGQRIQVEVDVAGQPLYFVWGGRRHPIEQIADQWRADRQWWRLRQWREHFKLVTQTGLLVTIYHDLVNDQWYLQRLYD